MARRIPQKAEAENTGKAASDMVCVMLNRPQGIKFALKNGKEIVELNGNAVNLKGQAKGILPIGGYGMTMVPRDQWEQVKKTYGNLAWFRNKLILEAPDKASANAKAEEHAETRNGLEPVDVGEGKGQTQAFDGVAV